MLAQVACAGEDLVAIWARKVPFPMLPFNVVPQTPRKLKWDYSMRKIAFNLKDFPALALVALLSGAPTMTRFAALAQLCVIVSLHLQYELQAEPKWVFLAILGVPKMALRVPESKF